MEISQTFVAFSEYMNFNPRYDTPARTLLISGLKLSLQITIFDLKMMVKSSLEFFIQLFFIQLFLIESTIR